MLAYFIIGEVLRVCIRVKHGKLVVNFVAKRLPSKLYSLFRVNECQKVLMAARFKHASLNLRSPIRYFEVLHEQIIVSLGGGCQHLFKTEELVCIPVI